jgi:hypothetical protein
MPTFNDTTITGKVTQSAPATNPNDLIRKGEADTALALKLNAADASVTNSRAPNGAAAGDLTGTYPAPTLAAAGSAGTYTKVTTDAKGRVVSGTTLAAGDIPAHAVNHKSGGSDPIKLDELAVPTSGVALNAQKLTGVQDPAAAQDAATKNYVDGRRLDQAAVPTASVNFNSQKATSVLDPSSAQDAATKNYVDTRKPHDLALATASVNLNSQKIINLLDPASAQDAATKAYVDAAAQGMLIKTACRLATTVNIALSGLAAIDSVTPNAADRILVKNQSDATQNGIYAAAAGAWSRATDADTSAEVKSGLFTFVSEGTVNANNGFTLTTANPIVLGTTPLVFTQSSGAGQITAGTGLTKTGNTLAADFGTGAGKVTQGNDARLTDARQMAMALADVNFGGFKGTNVGTPTAAADAATKGFVEGKKVHDFTAPTAALAMNAQKITGVADPTVAQDAATKNYVDLRRLDQAVAPTAAVSINSQRITSLAAPAAGTDATNRDYVTGLFDAFPKKVAVRCATTGNLVALSGLGSVDGVSQVGGDRTLVWNQSDPTQNGIYVAGSGAWTRAMDADGSPEIKAGMEVTVAEGTLYGDQEFRLTTNDPITLGVTGLVFVQSSGAGQITAGTGILKSASTLSVDFTKKWTDFAAPTAAVNVNSQKLSSVLDPTSAQDAATKAYADEQHLAGNLVFVDKVNGNNSTGVRGRSDLPFITLVAAVAAAASGDTVMVLPGTYDEKVVLKNGVNLHFVNGARIEDTGSSTALFNDGSGAVTCKITGQGDFVGTGDGGVLALSNASTVHLEGLRMESDASCISASAGTVVVKADTIKSGSNIGCLLSGSSVVDVTARQISGSTGGVWIEGTGSHNVRADLIQATGSGKGLYVKDGNISLITAREIKASGHYAVHCDTGGAAAQVTINGARIASTLATASGIAVFLTGTHAASAELILNRCTLVANVAGTPATTSIDGSAATTNVRFYGCVANLAKGANIINLLSAAQLEADADVK